MAEWPANGNTDWNTKMKANIDVGHDSDGTHKKSQMLTDMEWSPTSYAGEESVTFPNGLIMKMGFITCNSSATVTVTFGTAFPNGIVSATLAMRHVTHFSNPLRFDSKSTTNLVIDNNNGGTPIAEWSAIGY